MVEHTTTLGGPTSEQIMKNKPEWAWSCTCGVTVWGHTTEAIAQQSADLHRERPETYP